MILIYKSFPVNAAKIHERIYAIIEEKLDGVCDSESGLIVHVLEELTTEEIDAINYMWDHMTLQSYNQPNMSELVAIYQKSIANATKFGSNLIAEFATENVMMGITQANKTKVVTDYLHLLSHYISTGSLYAAIEQIDIIIADEEKGHLAPYITNVRMIDYKHKIQDYLQIPRT